MDDFYENIHIFCTTFAAVGYSLLFSFSSPNALISSASILYYSTFFGNLFEVFSIFFSLLATLRSTFLMSSAGGRFYASLPQHLPYAYIVLNVFGSNALFTIKVFLLHIVICHFCCEVFCSNGQRRKKICQRT